MGCLDQHFFCKRHSENKICHLRGILDDTFDTTEGSVDFTASVLDTALCVQHPESVCVLADWLNKRSGATCGCRSERQD